MRLSVETYHLALKFGYEKAFKMLKEAGFDAVDFSLYWENEGWLMKDDYREKAIAIRKLLDEAGLVCTQSHAPFHSVAAGKKKGVVYGEAFDESNPEFLETVRAMEVAAIMGAEHTVIHNLNAPFGIDLMEYNIPFFKSLLPYAEKFGINIAIENLFRRDQDAQYVPRLGSAADMNELIRRLDSDRFVLLVDVGHAKLVNIEPQDLIRELTPGALRGLHIQDTDGRGDRHILPYMGSIRWNQVMEALKKTGYRGDLTFEIPTTLNNTPCELMEATLAYAVSVGKHLISIFNNL